MNVGFSTMFAFRPHVEHAAYLASLVRESGASTAALVCDASVSHCFSRDLRQDSRVVGCAKCIVGGLRGYQGFAKTKISRRQRVALSDDVVRRLALSSVATALRLESPQDLESSVVARNVDQLRPAVESAYGSALRWIEDNQLDAIVCFNGRMDLTAAIVEAASSLDVPYVTLERPWFGHGLHLVPGGNCLSLAPLNEMVREFKDLPLTAQQVAIAAETGARRFLQKNTLERRLLNKDAVATTWPSREGGEAARVLILPSSRNELEGHPERLCEWGDYLKGFDEAIFAAGGVASSAVVRAHPNWSAPFGTVSGERGERHYSNWAERRGYCYFDSSHKASTYDLMKQADVIVCNGGSTGLEAALLGKPVITIGRAAYEEAGFAEQVLNSDGWQNLDIDRHTPHERVLKALRFIYTHSHRYTQYVNHVRSVNPHQYKYYSGGSASRLFEIFETQCLKADDPVVDAHADGISTAESNAVEMFLNHNWSQLVDEGSEFSPKGYEIKVSRRPLFAPIVLARNFLPSGDQ